MTVESGEISGLINVLSSLMNEERSIERLITDGWFSFAQLLR